MKVYIMAVLVVLLVALATAEPPVSRRTLRRSPNTPNKLFLNLRFGREVETEEGEPDAHNIMQKPTLQQIAIHPSHSRLRRQSSWQKQWSSSWSKTWRQQSPTWSYHWSY